MIKKHQLLWVSLIVCTILVVHLLVASPKQSETQHIARNMDLVSDGDDTVQEDPLDQSIKQKEDDVVHTHGAGLDKSSINALRECAHYFRELAKNAKTRDDYTKLLDHKHIAECLNHNVSKHGAVDLLGDDNWAYAISGIQDLIVYIERQMNMQHGFNLGAPMSYVSQIGQNWGLF